jgi:calnexin
MIEPTVLYTTRSGFLQVTEKARHYGYAASIGKEVDPAKGLVLQFELKLAEGLTCGGAYLKFLTASAEFDASGLVEDTPYVVMFGPDKCGATNKVGCLPRPRK